MSSLGIQLWWYTTALNIALFKNHILGMDKKIKAHPFDRLLQFWKALVGSVAFYFWQGLIYTDKCNDIYPEESSLTVACMLDNFVRTQQEVSGILQQIIACIALIFFHCI